MKTTYLIYKQIDGERQLAVATWEEWNIILKANKGLPMSERRLFEKNCFEDEGELDCMFIEVDREAYDEWHRRNEAYRYRHKDDANFDVRSLDEPIENSEVESLHEAISSGVSVADVRWMMWG